MSGKKLALLLCALCLLLAGWRWHAVGKRVEANSYAAYTERSLAAAMRRFGGALPRRFMDDNLSILEHAREQDPASVEAAVSQAGYLFLLRRYEAAEKVYLEALELEERPEIHANLGRLYLQQERFEEAIASFEKALKVDPQLAPTLNPLIESSRGELRARKQADKARYRDQDSPPPAPSSLHGLLFADGFEDGRVDHWSEWTLPVAQRNTPLPAPRGR
jgi:tetratricopeptide (TPR) repeat protein